MLWQGYNVSRKEIMPCLFVFVRLWNFSYSASSALGLSLRATFLELLDFSSKIVSYFL